MAFPLSDQEHGVIKARIEGQQELIIAAAVRLGRVVIMVERPGRHGNCINFLSHLGLNYMDQGFVTNRGRFVDRETAAEIVAKAAQGSARHFKGYAPALHSEDLWNDWDARPTATETPPSPEKRGRS